MEPLSPFDVPVVGGVPAMVYPDVATPRPPVSACAATQPPTIMFPAVVVSALEAGVASPSRLISVDIPSNAGLALPGMNAVIVPDHISTSPSQVKSVAAVSVEVATM